MLRETKENVSLQFNRGNDDGILLSHLRFLLDCLLPHKLSIPWRDRLTLFNLLFCVLIFAYPAIMIIYVSKNWDPVNKSWGNLRIIKQRFGAMFEELSMEKGPKVLIYPCYFMFRRLLLAIIVVIFKKFLWMQIFLNTMSIIIAVVILGEADYFETRFKRTMEFTNEVLVMFMLYNMISFSPLVPEI